MVVGLQTVCLAFGLWLHSRFVAASAQWDAKQQAWSELADLTRRMAPSLTPLGIDDFASRSDAFQAGWQRVKNLKGPAALDCLVVDRQLRVVFACLPHQPDSTPAPWKPGEEIAWDNPAALERCDAKAVRGTLATSAGRAPVLASRLNDGSGYLMVHAQSETPQPTAAMLAAALPAAGVITFLWVAGLQAIGTYVLLLKLPRDRARDRARSDEETLRRAQDLVRTRDAVIIGLAKLAEARDPDTGHHLDRIGLYSTSLAAALRRHPKFRQQITPAFVRLIGVSSALHDIGKVGIEDAILLKPAKLTKDEYVKMQAHTTLGGKCLQKIEQRLGTSNFLEMAREIALHHHESFDGTGYPSGLVGEQIPLAARIVAIADVYDAMAFKRVYKKAMAHEVCVDAIRDGAGGKFDPDLVAVFLEAQTQFREIARKYSPTRSTVFGGEAAGLDLAAELEEKVLAAL